VAPKDGGPDASAPNPCDKKVCGDLCNSCPPSAPLCPGAVAYCDKAGQCVIGLSPSCD
jgi:hypothetical protein